MGDGKRESNGCTVHFNSILQLLYIYIYINHKVSIKLWLNLKSAKKHLSFFTLLYFIFSFTFEHYKGVIFFLFLKSFLLFKLLLDRTFALWRIQHISFPVALKLNNNNNNNNNKKKRQKWIKWKEDFHATRSNSGVEKETTPLKVRDD